MSQKRYPRILDSNYIGHEIERYEDLIFNRMSSTSSLMLFFQKKIILLGRQLRRKVFLLRGLICVLELKKVHSTKNEDELSTLTTLETLQQISVSILGNDLCK